MKQQIIGVLGGMGPQASNELYRLLIEGARRKFGAQTNDGYPEILIDSVPVPDAFDDPQKMEAVAHMLENRVDRMTKYGATTITMACNTVSVYADRLQKRTSVPVISVIEEVVSEVLKYHKKVLLLASPTSLHIGLYQKPLRKSGIVCMVPEIKDYKILDSIICGVLKGTDRKILQKRLVRLTDKLLIDKNADAVILGCTELPLVFPIDYRLPVYSSLSILAESLLKRYYKEEGI